MFFVGECSTKALAKMEEHLGRGVVFNFDVLLDFCLFLLTT